MAINKKIKNLNGHLNDETFVKAQYTVPYSTKGNSRYKHIDEVLLEDGRVIKYTMGPMDMSIQPKGQSESYTVTAADENRIDIIATKVYGMASLYWVICYMNNIQDPLTQLTIGKQLIIPKLSDLRVFPNPLA